MSLVNETKYLGIPDHSMVKSLARSTRFKDLERFSNRFLGVNSAVLPKYKRVSDPLHAWSRLWEYPYCHEMITSFAQRSSSSLKILDAGSGWTFFPYYLAHECSFASLHCCDIDHALSYFFAYSNKKMDQKVSFRVADLRSLDYESQSFDAVYCISVLEHLLPADRNKAILQFKRVLRKDGLLIVSFDISLDGSQSMSRSEAETILEIICQDFHPLGKYSLQKSLASKNIIRGPPRVSARSRVTGICLNLAERKTTLQELMKSWSTTARRHPSGAYAPPWTLTIFAGGFLRAH
jgi:ubiquinone/menaquinone biosynthesis C-methylase UbiE